MKLEMGNEQELTKRTDTVTGQEFAVMLTNHLRYHEGKLQQKMVYRSLGIDTPIWFDVKGQNGTA